MSLAVVHSPEEWKERFGADSRSVLTIGNFDGVHLGHQAILSQIVRRARATGHLATVITFWPHPARVMRPEQAPPMIQTLPQRLAAMDALGLDAALILHFDEIIAALSPEQFVGEILCDALHASAVLVGENFRFGHRQVGHVGTLRELGKVLGFEFEPVPAVVYRGVIVSSSAVREAVRDGRISLAGRLLGRPFVLAGEIRTGTGTGSRVVFPTLNLSTEQELLPARGVYVTETRVEGCGFRSATNVGMRPTFDGTRLTVESHLFDFSRKITSGPMEVRFCQRLREERKFDGPDALRAQIQHDLSRARAFFSRFDSLRR